MRRVVLCLGHLGEQVVEAVGDGSAFGLEVAYSFDGPELRGTAGAMRRALPLLGPAFFVLYGDSYLECNYAAVQEAFEAAGKLALMTVFRNEGRWDTSNVEFRDGRILAYDKVARTPAMQYIDYGLGVLDRRAFDGVPESAAVRPGRRSTRRCSGGASSPASRSRSGSTRSARWRGSKRRGSTWPGEQLNGPTAREETMSHAAQFLAEAKQVIDGLDVEAIERMATLLEQARERGGRLFILGVGGSAANASHAVNDFRKIVGIEAYAPTDNVSELTARTNDEGWPTIFVEWLRVSRLKPEDLILVLSVGGGNLEKNVSPNLVTALAVRAGGRHAGHRHRRQGRRLHGEGGRGLRDRADGQPRPHHAALRGVPGGRLAPAGLAPAAQGAADEVGVGPMSRAIGRQRGSAGRSSSTATAC